MTMQQRSLEGRLALVTGGGRGVGRSIALALAQDGADVLVNYRRDVDSARKVVAQIETLGRRSACFRASVDDLQQNCEMMSNIEQEFGPIDILINNAGIASRGHSVVDTDPAELSRVLATHAVGPHHLCQLALPGMRTRERGDIIMISSTATRSLNANGAPYNMAKSAMEALAFTLAKEERGYGIRVNIVAPGLVETEMGSRLMKAVAGVDSLRQLDDSMPFGHVCQPEDVANVVRYLVSPQNSYVTGQKVICDGGGSI